MSNFKRVAIAAVLLLSLGLVACGANDVITALDLSIDAASIALPLVAKPAGISPVLQAALQAGFDTALADGALATDILAGPGTDAAKYSALVALYANVSFPFVPDQYVDVARAAQRVSKLISDFLFKLRPSDSASVTVPAKTSFLPEPAKGTRTTKLSAAQKKKLAEMKAKATAARVPKK